MSIHHGNGWIICGMGFQCFDSPTTCSFKFSLKFLEEYYASSSPDYWLRGHVPTRPIGVPWTFLLGWPGSHGGTLQKFPQNLMFIIKFLLLFDFTGEGAKPPSCPPPLYGRHAYEWASISKRTSYGPTTIRILRISIKNSFIYSYIMYSYTPQVRRLHSGLLITIYVNTVDHQPRVTLTLWLTVVTLVTAFRSADWGAAALWDGVAGGSIRRRRARVAPNTPRSRTWSRSSCAGWRRCVRCPAPQHSARPADIDGTCVFVCTVPTRGNGESIVSLQEQEQIFIAFLQSTCTVLYTVQDSIVQHSNRTREYEFW